MPSHSTARARFHARPRGSFLRLILHMAATARSRRALLRLDDHLLRDIGLTREDALAELDRPFWDAPPHWRR